MKRKPVITITIAFLLIVMILSLSTTAFALTGELRPAQQSSLPQITFLGQGPQTFTVEPPLKFLVKTYQNGVFLFVTNDGPTYQAEPAERVWTTNFVPAEPMRLFHEERKYGNVPAGCVINYVQIEDNIDTRRNTFYINGNVLQVVEQGMVTYGTFTVPEAGELTFYAEDSIGLVVEMCPNIQTEVPSETPAATTPATETVFPSLTATVGIDDTNTPAVTLTDTAPTATVSATVTATAATAVSTFSATSTLATPDVFIEPSQTPPVAPTATATQPSNNPTQTPSGSLVTATATTPPDSPRPTNTAILITATPISTPGAIPVTGGGPGPREIAQISAVIMGLFGLVAAGWWFLLRAYRNAR